MQFINKNKVPIQQVQYDRRQLIPGPFNTT